MKVELHKIKVSDLFDKYVDSDQEGVTGYHGLLDIRPKYQREFIYNDEQRNAVIDTVLKGFPLNIMYWVKKTDESGNETFEVLDGQQRTISICQYLNGDYSIDEIFFFNAQKDKKEKILNYELMVYFCEGDDTEKLEWFKTINIAGEKLTDQELRNAVYAGPWLTKAKGDFSKTNCRGFKLGEKYIRADLLRQELLETVLDWISDGKIEHYMAVHQHDKNDQELWSYYVNVIEWIQNVFTKYRKEMKGLPWGHLYNKYKDSALKLDPAETEQEVSKLMEDEDVTRKSGIYPYILSGEEKHLSVRAFDNAMKRTAYEKQKHKCKKCKKEFKLEEMEADHITPWSKGGKTVAENCQMLCKHCNRTKSDV
jgi:uncharacterized protein with ParB-like and HNH nuclease domain